MHTNLGTLLAKRAEQIVAGGSNLEAAAALYDEVVAHYTIAIGSEHEAVKANRANAARLRAGRA